MLWGIVHGLFVILERFLHRVGILEKIPALLRWGSTMLVVYFSWVLFMSPNIQDASAYFVCMFKGSGMEEANFTWNYFLTAKVAVLLIVAAVGSVAGRFVCADSLKMPSIPPRVRFILAETGYLFMLVLSMLFVVNSSYSPFLYFQF